MHIRNFIKILSASICNQRPAIISQMLRNGISVDYAAYVQGQKIDFVDSFTLESGATLQKVPVAYKTWGKLNEAGTNCMIICHALSGSCDAEEWWGPLLGPSKVFDTNKFFVFCGNVLGSPYGTCGPCTINPVTNKIYGPTFPSTTIRDDINIHKLILDNLGVKTVMFAIGGSMGGMQVLEWAFIPDFVQNIVPIATSGRHSAWCISWGEAQRQSIYSDPKYLSGNYAMSDPPVCGLSAARMAALLTYRSRNSFESRFGRNVTKGQKSLISGITSEEAQHNDGNNYNIAQNVSEESEEEKEYSVYSAQSYLRYQGKKFINRFEQLIRFDANCYISITRKLDTHDIARNRGEYFAVLGKIKQPTLIIGIASDGLFTTEEQHDLGRGIRHSQVMIIDSGEGHDGFLLEFVQMRRLLDQFIKQHTLQLSEVEDSVNMDIDIVSGPKMEADSDMLLW